MQRLPHDRTLISILRDYVEEWRKLNGWSRETVAQEIVEAHESLGAGRVTGIYFDPPTRDAFERMRVNADRIFRWLDDVTKDRNLLPANFIPTILQALPLTIRMHAADDLMRPVGLGCRAINMLSIGESESESVGSLFRSLVIETAEANVAVSELLDGETPDELLRAQRELTEALESIQAMLTRVEDRIQGGRS